MRRRGRVLRRRQSRRRVVPGRLQLRVGAVRIQRGLCGVAGSLRSGKCRVGVVQRRARLLLRRQSRVVGALIRRNGIGRVQIFGVARRFQRRSRTGVGVVRLGLLRRRAVVAFHGLIVIFLRRFPAFGQRLLPFGKLFLQVGGIQRADDVALAYRVAHLHKDLLDGIGERRGDVCHASALHRARDGDAL